MVLVDDVINVIEKFAPLDLAEDWDNSGWQINLGNKEANNVLVCLSLTPAVLQQAINNKCDLIIAHHPLIFKEFKKVKYETVTQKLIVDCIKNNIQVYSAHTNLDCAEGGVNDTLCEKLGLIDIQTKDKFIKIAKLPENLNLDAFILKLKISLNSPKIKIINPSNIQTIEKVALCCGSGSEFLNELTDVDAFITGDVRYHTALEVKDMVLIDAGHFETEKIILQTLKNLLHSVAPEIIVAKEVEPWMIVWINVKNTIKYSIFSNLVLQ